MNQKYNITRQVCFHRHVLVTLGKGLPSKIVDLTSVS